MSQRKKLPIGIQTFKEIRSDNYYYIDKTQLAINLHNKGKHYFLSRPRRFGKSLFLDTLKELFEGNEKLFEGLAAHKQWDWSVQYPVLRFSFGSKNYNNNNSLQESLHSQLTQQERYWEIEREFDDASGRLTDLILKLHEKTGQRIAILIDEYDKPILDALPQPDIATANRDFLNGFYGVIKDYDAHIAFSFITGVSKFSKVSIFSGLNNLKDITLDPRYATLCGYTDNDIDTVFSPELEGLNRNEIKQWYNGYNWRGEGVYNPFDILLLFDNREFKNYWFETGTPTFLVKHLAKNHLFTPKLDSLQSDTALLSAFDIDYISNEALLFQTGYLTLHKVEEVLRGHWVYTLGYPNLEVKSSLNISLLGALGCDPGKAFNNRLDLLNYLKTDDLDSLQQVFKSFFASIPYYWFTQNNVAKYEGYYASVFYSYFAGLGLDVSVEDVTNYGRIDMTVTFNRQVYIFEFKVVELAPEGKALQQIKDKNYAEKFKSLNQPIHLIGVEFSKDSRNIVGFDVETLTQ